jgi:NADPH2:quinone reductase
VRSVQVTALTGPSDVEARDAEVPVPGPGEVLIRVRAAGVAFPELLQTRGQYQMKHPLPFIPGSEVAGEIVSAPDGSGLAPGDRVVAFVLVGGFAEHVTAPAAWTSRLPDEVTDATAAALPLNYLTMHFGLLERGGLRPGESVLVHGAAGGIGIATIQVAKAFGAGRVVAVTSTEEKGRFALAHGADEFVLADGFKDAVLSTGPVDVVVDPVGGDRVLDSLRVLRPGGRFLVVGFTAGSIPQIAANRLLLRNISAVGVGWAHHALETDGYVASQWRDLAPHIASGALAPAVMPTFALEDAAAALRVLDERRALGKVVLTV